jgi:hypothetical protein
MFSHFLFFLAVALFLTHPSLFPHLFKLYRDCRDTFVSSLTYIQVVPRRGHDDDGLSYDMHLHICDALLSPTLNGGYTIGL